jgi:hypothetical protein
MRKFDRVLLSGNKQRRWPPFKSTRHSGCVLKRRSPDEPECGASQSGLHDVQRRWGVTWLIKGEPVIPNNPPKFGDVDSANLGVAKSC